MINRFAQAFVLFCLFVFNLSIHLFHLDIYMLMYFVWNQLVSAAVNRFLQLSIPLSYLSSHFINQCICYPNSFSFPLPFIQITPTLPPNYTNPPLSVTKPDLKNQTFQTWTQNAETRSASHSPGIYNWQKRTVAENCPIIDKLAPVYRPLTNQ